MTCGYTGIDSTTLLLMWTGDCYSVTPPDSESQSCRLDDWSKMFGVQLSTHSVDKT